MTEQCETCFANALNNAETVVFRKNGQCLALSNTKFKEKCPFYKEVGKTASIKTRYNQYLKYKREYKLRHPNAKEDEDEQ